MPPNAERHRKTRHLYSLRGDLPSFLGNPRFFPEREEGRSGVPDRATCPSGKAIVPATAVPGECSESEHGRKWRSLRHLTQPAMPKRGDSPERRKFRVRNLRPLPRRRGSSLAAVQNLNEGQPRATCLRRGYRFQQHGHRHDLQLQGHPAHARKIIPGQGRGWGV
jgi:hypothetical protein